MVFILSFPLCGVIADQSGTTALGSIITIQPRRLAPLTAIKHARVAIYLLAVSAVVFRAELVLLAAAEAGYLLLRERVPLKDVIFAGLAGTIVGLCVTVPIDSYLWGYYPLWPELSGFYYNTVQGRASAWGVSPWHYYFTAALPRLLLNPISWIVCIPVAIGQRSTASSAANILLPLLVFISLYSFLPHKEWRFIVYTVPAFSAVAAVGASWIWNRRRKTALYTLLNVILVGSVLLTFLASCVMLGISTTNYPGARALARLHSIDNSTASVRRLYLDNLSCQTGVTHFVERSSPVFGDHTVKNTTWLYDKAGDDSNLHSPAFWQKYDYILTESLETTIGKWQPVEVIRGYSGFEFVDESVHPTTQLDPVYIKFQVPSYWRIYSALSNVERGLRFHVTGGRWPNVRLEPKIWILKHQNPEAQRIHP